MNLRLKSGTGVLIDDAAGMYSSTKVYDDTNIEEIESLSTTQPHRLVDSTIVEADQEGTYSALEDSFLIKSLLSLSPITVLTLGNLSVTSLAFSGVLTRAT